MPISGVQEAPDTSHFPPRFPILWCGSVCPDYRIMVTLTRLNGTTIVVNAELIEMLEATPDTVITLINGKKLLAKESVSEVVDRVIDYRRRTFQNLVCLREEGKE